MVQVISLSLSFSLVIKLFELIVAFAPFPLSILYDGVGDVASEVIGSYLLLSVVVVDTVWSLYTFMSIFSLAHNFSCSPLLIKMCGSPLFPFERCDRSFCHTLSSVAPWCPCLTNCNRTGWIIKDFSWKRLQIISAYEETKHRAAQQPLRGFLLISYFACKASYISIHKICWEFQSSNIEIAAYHEPPQHQNNS